MLALMIASHAQRWGAISFTPGATSCPRSCHSDSSCSLIVHSLSDIVHSPAPPPLRAHTVAVAQIAIPIYSLVSRRRKLLIVAVRLLLRPWRQLPPLPLPSHFLFAPHVSPTIPYLHHYLYRVPCYTRCTQSSKFQA